MGLDSVSLRLQSQLLSSTDLAALAGSRPTLASNRGLPLSSNSPRGALRGFSTVIFRIEPDHGDLERAVAELEPILRRLGPSASGSDVVLDLIVAVTGTPLGTMVDMSSATVEMLCRVRCGLVFDVYSEDA